MSSELELAVALARQAGAEILRVYAGDFEVEQKERDQGPVTLADRRADAVIRAGLQRAFPGDGLLSEETPDDLARLPLGRLWLVDPLDGTRQFVERNGEFAVMIGLAVAGRAQLGVVHLPVENRTWAGAVGAGVVEIDAQGRRRRIVLAPAHSPDRPPSAVVSRNHFGRTTHAVIDELGVTDLRRSGSVGRKAMLVLSGETDFYLTLSARSQHWDACAPDALVTAAGGFFGDAWGRRMVYNTPATHNAAGILACRRDLLPRIVAAVERIHPEPPAGAGGR